jgi:hypothetical protein
MIKVVQNFSSFFESIWLTRPLTIYNTVHWSVRHTEFCTTKCLLSMIGVIIWERSNLLGKQGMILCTWMKHGLTKITAQIISEYHINSLCTELSSLLCIQSSWWYIKGMINGHQGKMLNMLYIYILIYWWNRLVFRAAINWFSNHSRKTRLFIVWYCVHGWNMG